MIKTAVLNTDSNCLSPAFCMINELYDPVTTGFLFGWEMPLNAVGFQWTLTVAQLQCR